MNATRTVVITQTVGMLVFLLAGGKVESLIARARGQEAPTTPGISAQTFAGWGFLFVTLIVLADIEQTGQLASAFAWLIFLSVLFAYGPLAFANISTMVGDTNAPYRVNNDDAKRGDPGGPGVHPR